MFSKYFEKLKSKADLNMVKKESHTWESIKIYHIVNSKKSDQAINTHKKYQTNKYIDILNINFLSVFFEFIFIIHLFFKLFKNKKTPKIIHKKIYSIN
jgi:hypothetical protein